MLVESTNVLKTKAWAVAGCTSPILDIASSDATPICCLIYDTMIFDGDDLLKSKARATTGYSLPVLGVVKNESGEPAAIDKGDIPMELWESILCFCDIPKLGACAQISKLLKVSVIKDTIRSQKNTWQCFYKLYLIWPIIWNKICRFIWDDCLLLPISERPLKSTIFVPRTGT